ncbi:DUF2125 domain-containing protein [Planktotalea sp.]|uniref:DUF2125 domain-containing protein n=1 Tax=Planktotalea sp. TaxID=2029877 RepID=UPI003D6A75DA
MSLKTAIFSTTSLVFLAGAASADVTAKNIWDDWKAYMSGFGYAVEAQEVMSGKTLQISDLSMTAPMPEGAGKLSITWGKIDFVENGDGTVNLVFPEVTPLSFSAQGPDGEVVSGVVEYTVKGMNMIASGDPSKVTYNYTADELSLKLNELEVEGEKFGADVFTAEFASKDLVGSSVMEPGSIRKIVQEMKSGATNYVVNFREPGGDDTVAINGTIASLAFDGETNIPAEMNLENMAKSLEDGFSAAGGFGYTGSSAEFAFTDGGDTVSGTSSAESARIDVRMLADVLEYGGKSQGAAFSFSGGDIPFPVSATLGEFAFKLLMPVSKSEDPSDFALGLTFGDFETTDLLWSMVDPGNVLPRDPATISFDLAGKAKMLFDLFDPEQMAAVEDGEAMPAELRSLTLNNLLVSLAGAKLTGTGDFTFDNSDLESFDGFPKPTGGIDLALVGGNGLMDKLVQMGLLPQEQAMAARMMMGLFTRPGEGDDSLTSKLEINEAGHILANGQRVQ